MPGLRMLGRRMSFSLSTSTPSIIGWLKKIGRAGPRKKNLLIQKKESIEEVKGETLNHVGHDTSNRSHNASTIHLGAVRSRQRIVSRKNASEK